MVKVIGLAGPGGVGKSTTAKGLVKAFNKLQPRYKVTNMAFADPIYQVANLLTGIEISTLKSQEYKEVIWNKNTAPMPCLIDWTPRKFLQIVGTECFRDNIHNNFWVESAIRIAESKGYDIVIMEDTRFPNEFEITDINIELMRDNIKYEENHASAMPPDPKYIDFKIDLHPDINYEEYVDIILDIIRSKHVGHN